MVDISPALYEQLSEAFYKRYNEDETIKKLLTERTSYANGNAYALRIGEILGDLLANIGAGDLPEGRMYYNIAEKVVAPLMRNNYELVANFCDVIQKFLNDKAGISFNPVKPTINEDRLLGILDEIANALNYDEVKTRLPSQMANYSQNVVTDYVQTNAEYHYKAGLNPKIVRRLGYGGEAGTCKWCQRLAGVYDYADVQNAGNDVWRHHEDCFCSIEFIPSKTRGKYKRIY